MPLCLHHVQWARAIEGGLHQCGLCGELVGWGDVYPRPEDLTEEFRARWKAHEGSREAPTPGSPGASGPGPRPTA